MRHRLNVHAESDEGKMFRCGQFAAKQIMVGIDYNSPEAQAVLSNEWADQLKAGELGGLDPWLAVIPGELGRYALAQGAVLFIADRNKATLGTRNGYIVPDVAGPAEIREE